MKPRNKIYLDYNATTPVDPRVLEEMLPWFSTYFGNASSDHTFGWQAAEAVELARERIAKLINSSPNDILFISGATEAVNMALSGLTEAGDHIVTSKTEHKAVLDTCSHLEKQARSVSYLDVDANGYVDLELLSSSIQENTRLISLMHSNNETGVIHPLDRVSEIARSHSVLLMTDATQSLGKIPFDVQSLGVDVATFSAHKLYGPKGIGAIYLSERAKKTMSPLLFGGGQEKGFRPGTLNVPAIVGFGKACEISQKEMENDSARLGDLMNYFEEEISLLDGVVINGKEMPRLPYTTNLSFREIDGRKLIRRLKNLAVSQGSACNSVTKKPSHVLKAMGLSDELALSSVRIGFGRPTTKEEVDLAIEIIKTEIPKLKTVHS